MYFPCATNRELNVHLQGFNDGITGKREHTISVGLTDRMLQGRACLAELDFLCTRICAKEAVVTARSGLLLGHDPSCVSSGRCPASRDDRSGAERCDKRTHHNHLRESMHTACRLLPQRRNLPVEVLFEF